MFASRKSASVPGNGDRGVICLTHAKDVKAKRETGRDDD